jgi:glucosamine kinase
MDRFVIGVDGGGTGCRARIADGEGRVLGTGSAGLPQ